MKLLIVRHGETVENLQRICQGQSHGTLSEKGIEQAIKIGNALQEKDIDICYTSDLKRATDTTSYIMKHHPSTPVKYEKRLRERYFGSFQGQQFPSSLAEFIPSEETETPEAIAIRLTDFLEEIEKKHRDKTVLLVSHGFTIRVLMSLLKKLPIADLETLDDIKNTSLSIAQVEGSAYNIILFNDTTHLKEN